LFSTVLSLVFVPAMFMVMDDIGSLIWRFGKKLVVSSADADHDEHDGDYHQPTPAAKPPSKPSAIAPAAEAKGRELISLLRGKSSGQLRTSGASTSSAPRSARNPVVSDRLRFDRDGV